MHWKLDRGKSVKKIAGEDKEWVEGPGKMCWVFGQAEDYVEHEAHPDMGRALKAEPVELARALNLRPDSKKGIRMSPA